ncbi:MAG: Hsp70 family protein, partial [Pseudomonadales bacterium]
APQIEVSFDLDANGILNVSAKDKATGKEQSIVIKASSGLSEAEIEQMVTDAESHAEEDRKFEALVIARNTADSMVHATRKSLAEAGDALPAETKQAVETAVSDLEEAIKTDDKDDIEAKTQKLAEVSGELAQHMFKDASGDGGAGGAGSGAGGAAGEAGGQSSDPDAVDAEFEEVKEDK